ncbi:amidohydrolase 2 [Arthrobacter sp. Hiyo4]|nr:amidohydrolase 2 [Arthrobacter sp. Hiyo4]
MDFQIPEDMTDYAPITTDQKKKILGLNAAALYDLEVPAELRLPTDAGQAEAHPAIGAKEGAGLS